MNLRYFIAGIIVIIFAVFEILPKAAIKLPVYSQSPPQIESAKTSQKAYPIPINNFKDASPITATSAVVIDFKTGNTLFEKDPNLKHLPASTVKLITALVALQKCSPETVVTVGDVQKTGSQMGLSSGDQITVENLLYGLLINSGNDAAYALATNCASSASEFVDSMNAKTQSLNMQNTHFANPAGFDNDLQYSTANDLAKLARVAVGNPQIAKIVATKSTVVTDVSGNKTYYLQNVNQLIGEVYGVEGVKTGETDGSLENLITKTTRGDNSIITVVLGSQKRFDESKMLIEWTFANFHWVKPN